MTGTGPWSWTCAGVSGGTTASCQAFTADSPQTPGPSAQLYANPFYECVRNFYVATNGNDNNSGTLASPWLTLQKADSSARQGGDCINVAPGTYGSGVNLHFGGSSASLDPSTGLANGLVVYRCTSLDACKITDPGTGFGIQNSTPGPNFLVYDGFELAASTPITYGIGVKLVPADYNYTRNASHHIYVLNNIIHGYGQSGVDTDGGDYLYYIHNLAYENSSVTCDAQGSGLTMVVPVPVSGYTPTGLDLKYFYPFHLVYAWNNAHDNKLTQCGSAASPYDTDGNGINLDTWMSLSGNGSGVDFPYPGLVYGNVSYNNGGGGITVNKVSYATIANNTIYNNFIDPFNNGTVRGDINVGGTYNSIVNNIVISMPATTASDVRCQGVNYGNSNPPNGCPLGENAAFTGGGDWDSTNSLNLWANNINLGGTPAWGAQNVTNFNGTGVPGNEIWAPDTMSCGFVLSRGGSSGNQCNINPNLVSPATGNFAISATSSTAPGFGQVAVPYNYMGANGQIVSGTYTLPASSIDVGACPSGLTSCP